MSEHEHRVHLRELLREACRLLTSYADTFTWDEDLNAAKDDLFPRIAKATGWEAKRDGCEKE